VGARPAAALARAVPTTARPASLGAAAGQRMASPPHATLAVAGMVADRAADAYGARDVGHALAGVGTATARGAGMMLTLGLR
jgi:hypothetical protein